MKPAVCKEYINHFLKVIPKVKAENGEPTANTINFVYHATISVLKIMTKF